MHKELQRAYFLTGIDSCDLTAAVDQGLTGVFVRRGLIESRTLAIRRNEELEYGFYHSQLGNSIITRDSPLLTADDVSELDEDGIVKAGTTVRAKAVAVSVLRPSGTRKKAKTGHCWVQNDSCQFPAELDGYRVVSTASQHVRERPSDFEPRMVRRIRIQLAREDSLEVGDLVTINGEVFPVIGVINDEEMPKAEDGKPVDLLMPLTSVGQKRETGLPSYRSVAFSRLIPTARDALRARSTGLYSLISLQPLRSRDLGSQFISASQVHWLHRNGLVQLASEFAALKSDDMRNRSALINLGKSAEPFQLHDEVGGPESLFVLVEELRALGLEVNWYKRTDHIALTMKPASLETMRALAPAQIHKPETINYRTYLPEPGGLFCEAAFGPESGRRRRTGAHLLLNHPVVPPIFRMGSHPLLCQALELDASTLEAIVQHRLGIGRDGQLVELQGEEDLPTGAEAIEQLLSMRQPPESSEPTTGAPRPYSWARHMVQSFVYVLPPDLRPLVLLDNGNFATSDLNDHYRQLINRNNRLGKLRQLKAPPVIIRNETRELQCMVDQLHANGQFHGPVVSDTAQPLKSVLDLVVGHLCSTRAKQQDWSGMARAVVDPQLPDNQCRLPATIFHTLRLSQNEPVLLSTGQVFVACYPEPSDERVVRLGIATAKRLELASGQQCCVFRPLTEPGVRESIAMVQSPPRRPFEELTPLSETEAEESIIDAIAGEKELSLDRPQWLIVGGCGGTACASDAELPSHTTEQIEFKKIVAQPPSEAELVEWIDSFAKTSMVFEPSPTSEEPEPHSGRMGGAPWLPEGTTWPFAGSKPVAFLAQLPLTPDVPISLPFPVAADSMLTIFWDDGWWQQPETSAPCLLVHSTENLQRVDPPRGATIHPLHCLDRTFKTQLPTFEEYAEALAVAFENLPRELLEKLRQRFESDEQSVSPESRVGGNAFWIQSPSDHFVAQIMSSDFWEVGDDGSLMIAGRSPESLTAWVESH